MAFKDFQFIRTKLSPALEVYLEIDTYEAEPWEEFIKEQIYLGNKVSVRTTNGGSTLSMSITGGTDTLNQGLILSEFGDNCQAVASKLQALLSLIDQEKQSWHFIEGEIKKAERKLADLIRENR